MGRIEKLKRQAINEANIRVLGEQNKDDKDWNEIGNLEWRWNEEEIEWPAEKLPPQYGWSDITTEGPHNDSKNPEFIKKYGSMSHPNHGGIGHKQVRDNWVIANCWRGLGLTEKEKNAFESLFHSIDDYTNTNLGTDEESVYQALRDLAVEAGDIQSSKEIVNKLNQYITCSSPSPGTYKKMWNFIRSDFSNKFLGYFGEDELDKVRELWKAIDLEFGT